MATPSPMNRGYGSGLAANRAPSTGLAANRAPSTGLAAGAPAGGGFRSSFQSSIAPMKAPAMAPAAPMPGTTLPPMSTPAPMEPMDFSVPEPPPVDFSNMFNEPPKTFTPEPLPQLGQQSFSQPPPSPFGPAPLPFGGFRQEGGPVQPGRAYVVGEREPEMFVPDVPGTIVPSLSPGARAYLERQKAPQIERSSVPVGALNMGRQWSAANGALPGELVGEYDEPNNGSRINANPANRRYSEMVPTNSNGPATFDSLANRAVRPVGRSMRDAPERRLETAARRGNMRAAQALVGLKQQDLARQFQGNQQQQQQDFQMQRDAQNFAQAQAIQAAAEQRAQALADQRWQQELTMQGLRTGEQAMRDERDRAQREAEQQAAETAGMETITDPSGRFTLPGIRTKGGQFRPIGGAYPTPQNTGVQMTPVEGTNIRIPTLGNTRVPGLPLFQEENVPGSFVRRATQGQPAPTQMTPMPETERWQLYDAPGPLVPHPYIKDMMVPGPPIKRQVDPITGETRDLVEQGAARPAAGAGGQAAATGDAQAPGWLDWLKQKTAAK